MNEDAEVDFCGDVIRYVEAHDPTPRQVPDLNRVREDEYADDMADLLVTHDVQEAAC